MRTAVIFILPFVAASAYGETFFSDYPLPDYYLRSDVLDCVDRFYKREWEENNREKRFTPDFDISNRIVVYNGVRAYNGEFRHMAAIGWNIEDEIKYFCGGSIILPKFILTAAHCSVPIRDVSPSTVRVGDTDLGTKGNDHLAQQIAIANIRRHPLHRHARNYHDIALIELEQTIIYNDFVGPACFWLQDHVPVEPMHIVGFGEVDFGLGPSLTLMKGSVSSLSRDSCSEAFLNNRRLPDGLVDGQFCASHATMDTCQGDSGGPIEVRRLDMLNRECPLIVGVTSFGTLCTDGSVGVYTKVSHYVEWIESETNETFAHSQCISRSPFPRSKEDSLFLSPYAKPVPYVHLLRNRSIESLFDCAGVLIDDQFVLTSAYCAQHSEGTPKYIYMSQTKEIVGIEEVIIHPKFATGNPTNDIALLKLDKFLNRNLKPACIAKPSSFSDILSILMFHTANYKDMLYITRSLNTPFEICTETLQENETCFINHFNIVPEVCHLAHGTPIMDQETASIPFLYGVVSFKSTDCDQPIYGTLVEPHLEWIRSVLVKYQRRHALIFT